MLERFSAILDISQIPTVISLFGVACAMSCLDDEEYDAPMDEDADWCMQGGILGIPPEFPEPAAGDDRFWDGPPDDAITVQLPVVEESSTTDVPRPEQESSSDSFFS